MSAVYVLALKMSPAIVGFGVAAELAAQRLAELSLRL
jgi:hypothetical protein